LSFVIALKVRSPLMNLVQFLDLNGDQRIGSPVNGSLRILDRFNSVYELVNQAIRTRTPLIDLVTIHLTDRTESYDQVIAERRLRVPLNHPDPARCWVSLTGLTHLGSAKSRDAMHANLAAKPDEMTDSMKMFRLGYENGKPGPGKIGAQPEWAFKGDGQCLVHPEQPILSPGFGDGGGEEAEITGLYIIDPDGHPVRIGYALGNEFADHELERLNYLYLAHSKLRPCSFGPELFLGVLPASLVGTVRIWRDKKEAWSATILTGEDNMCHSIANLEHHLFKYPIFRRPGDVHIHFFGASVLSSQEGFKARPGDVFEVECDVFGKSLRNPLASGEDEGFISVATI
jgi:hypothetical protein